MAQKCSLPPLTGRCLASMTRFFFNATSRKCEEFKFGGCEGNENRFDTFEQCKDFCGGKFWFVLNFLCESTEFPRHFFTITFDWWMWKILPGCWTYQWILENKERFWWIKHKIISTDNIVILTRSENEFRLNFKCLKRIDLKVLYNYIQKRPGRIEKAISCFYASWTPLTALLFHISCCTYRFFCVRLTIDIGHYSLALDACQLDPCPDPYSICSITDSGERKCECPAFCPKIYSPVCGSDRNNYSNECQMKVSACSQGMMIKVTSKGKCQGKLDFIALSFVTAIFKTGETIKSCTF